MSGVDIGTLSGRIEFEDHVSKTLDSILGKVDSLEQEFGGLGSRVAESAAGFFTAEAAMAALKKGAELATQVLSDLTVGGSGMASVAENFERLTAQAGRLSSTLLNELREGTHNTIDDMTLMKSVNQDLAAGMNLTDQQYRQLADGAFALAQATGKDVKEAYDIMNQSMLTGQTRAVQALTGKIDLTKAERNYAEQLGITVDRLSEEGQLEAKRIAILQAVGAATERLGEQTDGVGEIVQQINTSWANFHNDLSIAVASSPEVIAAFLSIKDSLVDTFGGDKADMIKTVTGWVDNLAQAVQEHGPGIISTLGQIASAIGTVVGWIATDVSNGVDFFHRLGLMVQGYGVAEAGAIIETQKLMQAQEAAARSALAQEAALAKAAQQADTIDRKSVV